ncbi:hypothetical protein B0I35DRAFT_428508 [Stachybotrys elegans]|uniref:NmrA-like domain-containing protein n=1 Tax=Stachybotrys elegans TaxID=80388 RepID=A0A8K0WSQ7_9HYPO|nr:hypothetical protein B0I35DRAFT_428508 [Stachybotrys elegans]
MSTSRVIVVLGATGGQGSGVVAALLNDASGERWSVHAVTRDPSSERAQKLVAENQTPDGRLSVVYGDQHDPESLRKAMEGAYGVFAAVSEMIPGTWFIKEEEVAHELEAGRNIVDAAKHNSVEHFVFSSMPDMIKATAGRYTKLHHMHNKFLTEQYARTHLDAVTCLIAGFFYANNTWSHYARRQSDGVVCFSAPFPSSKAAQWVDASYDMGRFAARVFSLGKDKTKGKVYPVMSPKITMNEMVSMFTSVTGQPAIHSPLSADEWARMASDMVGPAFREDFTQMMEWTATTPDDKICFGALDPEEDRSKEELGLTASTFADWLKRTGWTGPAAASSS